MIPYFYKLIFIPTGQIYIGIQYNKKSTPDDLLKKYKTSSVKIKKLISEHGIAAFSIAKTICFETKQDCIVYEQKYLRRMWKVLGREKFLSKFLNRNRAPGVIHDIEILEKMSNGIKAAHERGCFPTINPFKNRHHSVEAKKFMSDAMRTRLRINGHPKGFEGKQHTTEARMDISKKLSGKNGHFFGVYGDDHPTSKLKWYNNGIEDIRTASPPGDGWNPGRIYRKRKRLE